MRRQLSCHVGLCGVHLLDALRPTDSKLSDSCDQPRPRAPCLAQTRATGANVGACGFVDVLCFSRYCENAEQREDAFSQAASELEG